MLTTHTSSYEKKMITGILVDAELKKYDFSFMEKKDWPIKMVELADFLKSKYEISYLAKLINNGSLSFRESCGYLKPSEIIDLKRSLKQNLFDHEFSEKHDDRDSAAFASMGDI